MNAFSEILKSNALTSFCQPVFEVSSGLVHSVECLTRPSSGSLFQDAETLFQYARDHHMEAEADLVTASASLAACSSLDSRVRVALNFHAVTLARIPALASHVVALAAAAYIRPERLIIEILEHDGGTASGWFTRNIHDFRESGAAIALDDFGAGRSNLQMLVRVRPEYVKLDRDIVTGIADDSYRRQVVASTLEMSKCIGFRVVAEGVETAEDLQVLNALGIELCQGFLLCRPMPAEWVSAYILAAYRAGPPKAIGVAYSTSYSVQQLLRIPQSGGAS